MNSGFSYEPGSARAPVPNAARIYDHLLGGKDNFEVDRAAAARVMEFIPHAAAAARQNRAFLGRAVTYLAAEAGIRQFLDIGSGLPTADNTHQVAQRAAQDTRVVYVDYDPVVLAHARALLGSPGVLVVEADLRYPGKVIGGATELLDFTRPVAVLLNAVLHFITNEEDPWGIAGALKEALVPGSALEVSHITGDGIGDERSLGAQQVYAGVSAPAVPRTLAEVTRFFDGLELVPPGVTDVGWWPGKPGGEPAVPLSFYGGVAVKR